MKIGNNVNHNNTEDIYIKNNKLMLLIYTWKNFFNL